MTPQSNFETQANGAMPSLAQPGEQPNVNYGMLAETGATMVATQGGYVTAQRVALPRDEGRVISRIKALAGAAGQGWYYRIPFKNRKSGTTTYVEGPSIHCAMDIVRLYGNCHISCLSKDEGPHWLFLARFVDLETGFTFERPFQQRKGQGTGMKDSERASDIVYQIGASKAIRNVVVNALRTFVDAGVSFAKDGLKERIGKDQEAARGWIRGKLIELGVDQKNVERLYGLKIEKWTVDLLARAYGEVQAVRDGFVAAEDFWPEPEDEAAEAQQIEKQEAPKAKAKAASKPKPKAKETDQSEGNSSEAGPSGEENTLPHEEAQPENDQGAPDLF